MLRIILTTIFAILGGIGTYKYARTIAKRSPEQAILYGCAGALTWAVYGYGIGRAIEEGR